MIIYFDFFIWKTVPRKIKEVGDDFLFYRWAGFFFKNTEIVVMGGGHLPFLCLCIFFLPGRPTELTESNQSDMGGKERISWGRKIKMI